MKPELLAPAGTLEKLKYAVAYGADAVYFGGEFGSLRSFAGNFTFEEAAEGLEYLHERGKKGYIALNIYPFSEEYGRVVETAKTLDGLGADAFIVSDAGVMHTLKGLDLRARVHISTQANVTSWQTVTAYAEMGAARVNLARELSLERIREIQRKVRGKVETEVFIHGAVCFSYSGRCAISDYLTGFAANRGECKHPCRWRYSLVEEKRPGEHLPVFEDERGLYLFNSKELALFGYVNALAEAGVDSFKIEGRMKSIHYVATVVSFYRQLLDGRNFSEAEALEWLNRVPNRGYSTGFMKGSVTADDYAAGPSTAHATSVFVGNVTKETSDGNSVLQVRNRICAGDKLEVLRPDGSVSQVTLGEPLATVDGQSVEVANNSRFVVLNERLPAHSVLRRLKTSD